MLTSHDMNDVEAISERVVIIKGGLAAFDGNLTALRAHANIPKEVVLSYRDAPQLPPEHLGASIENGTHTVRLRLGDEPIGELVQAASRWGELLDFRIIEASLDEVMSKMFSGGGSRS